MLRCSVWRRNPESNRDPRICNPLHSHSAIPPFWSGKRDSNSRPRPWQGRALPTELFPLSLYDAISSFISVLLRCSVKRGVHSTYPDKTVNSKNHQNAPKYLISCLFAFFLPALCKRQTNVVSPDVQQGASRPLRCIPA